MSTSVIYSPMSPPSLIYTDFGIAHTVSQLKAYLIWPPYNIVNKKEGRESCYTPSMPTEGEPKGGRENP